MEFRYCQYCKVKSFARIDNFKRHETVCFANPNRINFFCDVCGKTFTRKDNLSKHLSKMHKHPQVLPINNEIMSQVEKYLSNSFSHNELFSVIKTTNRVFVSSKHTKYQFRLTKLANSLCEAGYMFNLMSDLMEYVLEQSNLHDSSDLCQIVVEHISLDYPISSGMIIGTELNVNDILNRIDRTLQSEKLISTDKHNHVIISLFEKTYHNE